jgi:hypothetical protein
MIALISNDAGGAEFIGRYALKQKEDFCIAAKGPAKKIFFKLFKKKKIINVNKAIKKSDWVLCSTGTSSNYEKNAMINAKKQKKKLIAYIDHWVEYKKRFLKNNKLIRPDEIWVSDKYAFFEAQKNNFKNIKIKGNPLINDFIRFKNLNSFKSKKNILFLSEPVSIEDRKYYTELKCIKYFIKNLEKLKFKFNKIQIRPHPSENLLKFSKIKKLSSKIFISKKNDIYYDILSNDYIIGINTIALVLGLIANKKVISCIPGIKKCKLPHKNILSFKELINEKR